MIKAAEPEGGSARSLIAPAGSGGPTVLRILLGTQLRRLRERSGSPWRTPGMRSARPTPRSAAWSWAGPVPERDVADLLTLYGVDRRRTSASALLTLARQANAPGWWHRYGDILPSWFEVYIGLEEAASLIRTYEVQFVPGLLQTEEYARAVILLGHPARVRPRDRAPGRAADAPAAAADQTRSRRTCGRWWTRRCCGARSAARR